MACAAALACTTVAVSSAQVASATTTHFAYGSLVTGVGTATNYPSGTTVTDSKGNALTQAQAEKNYGATVGMMEFGWDSDEPTAPNANGSHNWSPTTDAQIVATYRALESAGLKVTLSLGLHYTPSWVKTMGGVYVDEKGNQSTEADFVFSPVVRNYAQAYITHLISLLAVNDTSPTSLTAIRINSGGDAELMYPDGGTYWAYDQYALSNQSATTGIPANPVPKATALPGAMTASQAKTFANWYIGALVNVAKWQTDLLSSLGYSKSYQYLTPGQGVFPSVYNATVGINPDGSSQTGTSFLADGLLGRGVAWQRVYAALAGTAAKTRQVAYVSSVGDLSGNNVGCDLTNDPATVTATNVTTSSAMNSWSSTRWITRLAGIYGFASVGGENPGYFTQYTQNVKNYYLDTNDSPGTASTGPGLAWTSDNLANSCNLSVFYWAHSNMLWSTAADGNHMGTTVNGTQYPNSAQAIYTILAK